MCEEAYQSPDLNGSEAIPSSYAVQTLQSQTVDFSDSRQYITQASACEVQQDALNKNKEARLLDVIIMKDSARKTNNDLEDEILVLHVTGVHQNELGRWSASLIHLEGILMASLSAAMILSAPKFTRSRNESTFEDFSLYNSADRVTVGTLRQADDEEAEAATHRNQPRDGINDNLLSERFTIHTFPTRICAVEFGPEASSYGHYHTGPWVCIRTMSSTVFATVGVSSRKERLQGYKRLRLVALLEIQHGDSMLSSGVTTRKYRRGMIPSDSVKATRSRYPVVDIRYHPQRCTSAVTIDSMGNVGVFDCDLFTVKESSWEKGVSWSLKQGIHTEERVRESHWMIEWAEEDETVVLANRSVVQLLSLKSGTRRTIHTCEDRSIVSMTRSSSPSSLLWVVTSKDVLLFDLRIEASAQALLSWEHCCSHSSEIRLSGVETTNDASAVLLSNRCNRLLSVFSATGSSSLGPASTTGEATQLYSGLPCKEAYATAPVFVKMADLHTLWDKWVRRWSLTNRRDTEQDQLMIEMARDGSVWIRIVSWSGKASLPRSAPSRPRQTKIIQEEIDEKPQTSLPEITAQRSLHSFGPVYRVLMSGMSAEGLHGHGALSTIFKASRWLQEQEMPIETMLLPHDLLAFGHTDDSNLHNLGSVLMQTPLLSMSMAASPGVQRLLQQLFTSMQSDAWTMDLAQLIDSQLYSRVPGIDTMDEISERLTKMYISQIPASRSLTPAIESLASKIRDSCREIGWDVLLSSRVISMRPIVVQEEEVQGEEDDGRENSAPLRAPPFSFSFFTPRLAMPNETTKTSRFPVHQNAKTRKRIMTKSARWLLDEWKIGNDPKNYRFTHPYGDDHASEQEVGVTGSDDYRSQSESEQHRSSRDQSKSSRSMSRFSEAGQQRDSPSIPLPPTIESASQPAFAAMPSQSSRRLVAQSQPVFASSRFPKPKKRRVGGF